MSFDLCLPIQAEKPYYIENIRTGIYSLEELCFYLYNNIYLIDESIVNESLCNWIRDELKLARLYRSLMEQLEKKENIQQFTQLIFREAGYLTNQELHDFSEKLSRLDVQSDDMKQKMRADYLVREKMFGRAVWEYKRIMKRRTPGKLGVQFYAAILNNMGCAYAGLFQFQKAAECFWESYSLMKTKESFRKYVSALPLFLSGQEYQKKIRELEKEGFPIHKIQEYNAEVCRKPAFRKEISRAMSEDKEQLLEDLKEQYYRSTKI